MKKTQIKIPLILPEVRNGRDRCVHRLMDQLQNREGIEMVHIASDKVDGVPQLCFHYDPEIISIERIQFLVISAPAFSARNFGHKLIEVEGIRHVRHGRLIEQKILSLKGILEASVSASGMVRVEFETAKTDEPAIFTTLRKEGLDIQDTDVSAEKYLQD